MIIDIKTIPRSMVIIKADILGGIFEKCFEFVYFSIFLCENDFSMKKEIMAEIIIKVKVEKKRCFREYLVANGDIMKIVESSQISEI